MIRSATSAGANWEETCGAESRADFIHKMQIVLKELKETKYWMDLLGQADIVSTSNSEYQALLGEVDELTKIVAKSVVSAKSK